VLGGRGAQVRQALGKPDQPVELGPDPDVLPAGGITSARIRSSFSSSLIAAPRAST